MMDIDYPVCIDLTSKPELEICYGQYIDYREMTFILPSYSETSDFAYQVCIDLTPDPRAGTFVMGNILYI